VADADVIAHVDVGALVPNNYKVLTNLPNQPQIKASPELAKAVRKMVAEIDGPRGLVKGMTGIDLITDVSDLTAFVQIVPRQDEPNFVVSIHGKFSTTTIDRSAKAAGKASMKVGAGAWFDAGDGNAVAVTKSGTLLVGTQSLIKDRLADAWKAPAMTAGQLANAREILGQKPVFALVVNLSPTARAQALAELKGKNFVTDHIKRHKLWSFSVYRDGIGWSWIDSSRAGLDAMAQMSDGFVDVRRASQIAPRGFGKILLGGLESYKGTNKQVDAILRRRADLLKLVETYTGDGQFKAQIDTDPRTLKLTARLTGKSLSEVMPLGGLLPIGVAWATLVRGSDQSPPPMMIAPPPPPAPAKKQGNRTKRP